jgi:alpha-glucosidase (family GH31 glycosyl hydrolase)
MGEKNDELYLRHLQYGVFSPINRLHCACFDTMTKEPWQYGNGAGAVAEEFLRLRHRLIPYLYTASYQTNVCGKALVEPLYYQWKEPEAYAYKEEYLFGSELLVAPVTSKGYPDGYARVKAWLPEGKWTDIFTGDEYEVGVGGKELILLRNKDSLPVFAKAGGILPLSMDKGNAYDNPEKLEIWAFEGNGGYTLYEDGKEQDKNGMFLTRLLSEYTEQNGKCVQTLTISSKGDNSVIPQSRTLSVRFKNIPNAKVRLYIDGVKTEIEEWLTYCAGVKIPFEAGKTYCIEAKYEKQSDLDKAKHRAKEILTQAEGENKAKYDVYCSILKAENVEEILSIVEVANIPEIAKLRFKETIL